MTSTLKADKIEGVTASGTVQMPAGHVIQLVTNEYSTANAIASTTYVDSGLTCQITPKFSTSKIFIQCNMHFRTQHPTTDSGGGWKIFRDSTNVKSSTVNYSIYIYDEGGDAIEFRGWQAWNFLDSPSTTSQITYKVQLAKYGGGIFEAQNSNNTSTMTLMEVAQ